MASDNNTMDADLGGDSILISNLQLAHPVTYPNVWGIEKEQPALISVALSTRNGFASAADKDALDNSTIHYGELAKRIRRIGSDNEDGEILDHRTAMTLTHRICANMAQKDDNSFILARSEVALDFTKACMFADSAGILTTQTYDNDGNLKALSTKLGIKGIQVPTLIGVNGYERTGKQPVVASITIFIPTNTSIHGSVAIQSREFDLFRLERRIIEVRHNGECCSQPAH